MTATVDTPSERYNIQTEKRRLARTLMGGTVAMQKAGKEFMPQHPAESDGAYAVRLKGTTLYNGFEQAIQAQTGKVFSSPVIVGDDVPDLLKPYLTDMDGQGRELTPFAMDLFADAMVDGVTFILVDFPVILPREDGTAATLADQLASGARPYCVPVLADNLISWSSASVGGKQVLTEARIRECTFEKAGEWGEVKVNRIRVLRPGYFGIHRKISEGPDAGQYALESEGVTSLKFIPLVPVYANRTGFFEGAPPLQSLAELNLEHWISSSENRKALTFLRFAMLAIIGVDAKATVEIGPDKVLRLPVGADAKYLEHTGAGITAGFEDLAQIEARMQHAGMTVRVENAGTVTATAAAIDSADSNAGLLAIADGLGDSLELVLNYMAMMLAITTGGGTLEVNDDFGEPTPVGTTAEIQGLVLTGLLSVETGLNELKRRGVLDDSVKIADELERIAGMATEPDATGEDQQTDGTE